MIAVVSDTHSRSGHELGGRALEAVRAADLVVHAGDFTTETALDAFEDVSERLVAVHGNNATPAVKERLPAERTVEAAGLRIAVVHGHDHTEVGLSLLGRERDADLVVFGHSHRHAVVETDDVVLVNPGSHAQPRGGLATHVELKKGDGDTAGEVRHRDGSVIETFGLEP